MKKKKALLRLEAALAEVDRQSEHNMELRRTQIQLTRRLEDGQAWANAATSRIRQAEEEEQARHETIDELHRQIAAGLRRIESLTAMNEEAGRVIRDKTQALQIANETIRRRERVIEYYARRYGADPDDIGDDRERRADGDDDNEESGTVTITFGPVGIDGDGNETEIKRFSKTFPIDVGADDPDRSTDDTDDGDGAGLAWSHCGDPGCVVCNAAEEMFRNNGGVGDSFVKGSEAARQEQRRRVFAELGEVLDEAARKLNRPFTNGKGVQSWELRGQLAALQIAFAQLNANDLGMQDDPPAYRALRSKIIDFARGVRDLTGEDFGDLLSPQRALADGADPSEVPAPWGTANNGPLWERIQAAFQDDGAPLPRVLRELVEMAQTSTNPPEDAERAAPEVELLRPAGALAVHVHETVDAAGGRILEVENIRAGANKRFYIMQDNAGVPHLVPLGDLD